MLEGYAIFCIKGGGACAPWIRHYLIINNIDNKVLDVLRALVIRHEL